MYGNIATIEQLDFLQENFLDRLEKKYPNIDVSESARKKRIEDFISLVSPQKIQEPLTLYAEGPSGDGESLNTVLVNWLVGRSENAISATEKVVLTGILCNHDGSPLQKALIESSLGEDLAPQNGLFSSIYTSTLTVGLRGVKNGDEKKVEKIILDKIKSLVENGIPEKDIESTLMTLEFSHREIKRGHGPFAISLMARPIYGWLYGDGIENQIRLRSHLKEIRKRIENDKSYLKNLLKKLLLENKSRSLVIVAPSKDYTTNREKAEKLRIKQVLETKSLEEIKAENESLHIFQQKNDDSSCLPHLKPEDFIVNGHPMMNKPETIIDSISGFDKTSIPFIKNIENTNGIIYFNVGFPADVLAPSDYPLLPVFSDCVTECGWKDLDWAHASEECALHTGGLGVNLLTMEGPNTENAKKFALEHNWVKRDWIIFRISMIEEQCEEAMRLLKDCLIYTNFSDEKRIQDILNETKNDFESSIIPDGHIFVSTRALCRNSRKNAIDEIWNGITQYFTIKKLSDSEISETIQSFKRIFEQSKNGGAFIHATAEKTGFEKLEKLLPDFINEVKIHAPENPKNYSDSDFYELTKIGENYSEFEAFSTSSQVGFAAECISASRYEDKNSYSEEVCTHWLSNNLLWEKIRTIGGAYGAFCNAESMSGALVFASYRDPVPFDSELDFSDEDVICAIMGCYSHFIQPQSPKGRGTSALTRVLYGILDEDRESKILGILNTSPEDLKNTFKRLYLNISDAKMGKLKQKAIICSKKSISDIGFTGKIINMPL